MTWTYESECYVAWRGPVLVGRVNQEGKSMWKAWALGKGDRFYTSLLKAQAWVEKQCEDIKV